MQQQQSHVTHSMATAFPSVAAPHSVGFRGDDDERTEPLAFTSGIDSFTMDAVDLFAPPLTLSDSSTDAVFDSRVDARKASSSGDFYLENALFSLAPKAHNSVTRSPAPSVIATASVSSSGTESEHTTEATPSSRDTSTTAPDAQPTTTDAMDAAELRRKRNRESMRRVRLRKRDAKRTTQQTVEALEATLQRAMETNARAAQQLALTQSHRADAPRSSHSGNAPTFAELLSETAALSYANKSLRDQVQTYCVLEASLARMLDDEQLQIQTAIDQPLDANVLNEADAQRADAAMLAPLLAWLTPSALDALIALATRKIEANAALVASLVPEPNAALGWTDQRCVDGTTARYLLRKTFRHESIESLASKTWACIVDIAKLSQVMRWAKDMKVLHWLRPDAAIVTRELTIPSPRGPETRFRFTLLVYKSRTRDGGYCMGTINLNVFGTTVDECLAKDATYQGGVHAHTMYGWTFSPSRDGGCTVELAGLTGNGTLAYAHNVVMEMITVVLLWESTLVAQLKLLRL